jgi:thiol-disulfide isomerase/thioredoxin
MVKLSRLGLATILAGAILAPAGTVAGDGLASRSRTPPRGHRASDGELASLASATAWLNSPPLAAASLRGRVVLVQFWTYTCINWLRSLPHVRAWADRYQDRGLVVIGVHAPEFPFERNVDDVRQAAGELNVAYPIAVDNDFVIWRAFDNAYWPALYLLDGEGRIRHRQFGEGGYEQAERVIQQLLADAGARDVGRELVVVDARGAEAAADWGSLQSPETYLGYGRALAFASPGGAAADRHRTYDLPTALRLNHWALAGQWTVRRQAIVLSRAHGRIAYRFHARDLHLVMGPARPGAAVRFRVLIDGRPPGAAHGMDLDAEGNGTVTGARLYQLIRQPQPITDRQFEIEFLDPGVEVFAFTFG